MAYQICDNLNDLWFLDNAVDTATLTGASASPDLGPTRLRDPRLGKAYRTAGNPTYLTISFPASVPLQVFALFGLNPYDANMNLRIGTAPGLGDVRTGPWNPLRDSYAKQVFWINAVENGAAAPAPMVREIMVTFNQANVDVGRAWAGDYFWTPAVSHTPGSQQSVVDLSSVQRTKRSGAVLADRATLQRLHQIDYSMVSQDEWLGPVRDIDLSAGISHQVLFVPNYTVYPPEKFAILGYNEQLNPITSMSFDRFGKSFNLREAG